MDIKTYCIKFMAWAAVLTAIVLLICGLCFGRIIEANIYEEVGKWLVMGLFIIVGVEALAYTLSQFFYHGGKWDPTSPKYLKAKGEVVPVRWEMTDGDLKIYESHAVSKVLFREVLDGIRDARPDSELWKLRTMSSLRHEWASHNLAYALNFHRDRTADVDLNFVQKWYEKVAYAVVGTIAFAFIK